MSQPVPINSLSAVLPTAPTPATTATSTANVPAVAVPKSTEDLWSAAVELLDVDDQERLRLRQAAKLVVLSDALDTAQEKKKLSDEKRWKYKRSDGREVPLHEVFGKVVLWINKFKDIGTMVSSFDPVHAALPWAAVCALLQIVTGDTQSHASMIESMELIPHLITKYAIFEELYLRESSKTKDLLAQAVVKLYSQILAFLVKATKYFTQRSPKRIAKGIMNIDGNIAEKYKVEIQAQEAIVQELGRLVDAESLRNAVSNSQLLSSMISSRNVDLQKAFNDLQSPISQMTDHLTSIKRLEILEWISKMPYLEHHQAASRDRLKDSGLWLLAHDDYIRWRSSTTPSLLWIHGIPGSGKSKLMSLVIDTLRMTPSNAQTDLVAYVYCVRNTSEPQRADAEAIARSILRQLASPVASAPIQEPILRRYRDLHETEFDVRDLGFDDCKALIIEVLKQHSATIVVDALDECLPERRYRLIKLIEDILSQAATPVRVLISSRNHNDVALRLDTIKDFQISMKEAEQDIEAFVEHEVDRLIRDKNLLHGQVSSQLRVRLINTLTVQSQGMFLWASLKLKGLQNSDAINFESDAIQAIQGSAEEIDRLYADIYYKIGQAGATTKKVAMTALQWLLCSQRPLSTADFISAVTSDKLEQDRQISANTLLELCGNLVVIDTDLDVFRFVHSSALEFLETREELRPKVTNATVARVCLGTLSSRNWLVDDTTWEKSTLYQYATLYWALHIGACGESVSEILDDLHDFVRYGDGITPQFKKWLWQAESAAQILSWDDPVREKIQQALCPSPETSIFTACVFGLRELTEELCKTDASIVRRANAIGSTPLHLASQYGQLDIVGILLGYGAIIDAKDENGETPLVRASVQGHEDVTRCLLRHGADLRIQGTKYGSSLQAASLHGNTNIVRLLCDDSDIEAGEGQFGTSLQSACLRGHLDVVKLLLRKGANVNTPGRSYATTSPDVTNVKYPSGASIAIEYLLKQQQKLVILGRYSGFEGFRRIADNLLDLQLDVNIHAEGFGPAISCAARGGHTDIIQLLLDHGADVNAEGGAYGHTLQAAVLSKSQDAVHLLLSAGADVDTQHGMYNTALQAACRKGDQVLISTLLDHQANVNALGGIYGTPLQAACRSGDLKIIKILLKRGADVDLQSGHYNTALQAAAVDGYEEIVQLLIDHGAHVDLQGGKFHTALQAAATNGHESIVRLLLEHGAKPYNALQIAAYSGHVSVVKCLLASGVDVNTQSKAVGTALQAAAAASQGEVFNLLLQEGADANSNGQSFGTTLQIAASTGNKEMVRILLDNGADPRAKGGLRGLLSAQVMSHGQVQRTFSDWTNQQPYETALMSCAAAGNLEVLKMLLDTADNTDINSGALTVASEHGHLDIVSALLDRSKERDSLIEAMGQACRNGHEDVVKLLTQRGALSKSTRLLRKRWLCSATKGNHRAVIEVLLEAGLTISKNPRDQELSPLHIACYHGYTHLVRLFLSKQAVSLGKRSGPAALLLASVSGDEEIVKMLLPQGASPDSRVEFDLDGDEFPDAYEFSTAIQAAAATGNPKLFEILLAGNPDVSGIGQAGSALYIACDRGYTDIVQMLLDRDADVNAQSGPHSYPLHAAANCGNVDIVQLLLDKGADVNVRGGLLGTAIQAAAANGHLHVVRTLIKRGADVRSQGGYARGDQFGPLSGATWLMPGRFDDEDYYDMDSSDGDSSVFAIDYEELPRPADQPDLDSEDEIDSKEPDPTNHTTSIDAAASTNEAAFTEHATPADPTNPTEDATTIDAAASTEDATSIDDANSAAYAIPSPSVLSSSILEDSEMLDETSSQDEGSDNTSPRSVSSRSTEEGIPSWTVSASYETTFGRFHNGEYGTALSAACTNGHVEIVELLLQQGADVHERYRRGQPISEHFDHQTKYPDISAKNGNGRTPLHHAARKGHDTIVDVLLRQGDSVEKQEANRPSLLQQAVQLSHSFMSFFQDSRPDINAATVGGITPLHDAASNGHLKTAMKLHDNGAQLEMEDVDGNTPLSYAIMYDRPAIVQVLLRRGASVRHKNKIGRGLLHLAAKHRNHVSIQQLIVGGLDVNSVDENGKTALHAAASVPNGNYETLSVLLAHGAVVDLQDQDGNTPLHDAASAGNCVAVNLLALKHANINAQNSTGATPLHAAVQRARCRTVHLLVEHKAYIEIQDHHGLSPLGSMPRDHFGDYYGPMAVLLNAGAHVNKHRVSEEIYKDIQSYSAHFCAREYFAKRWEFRLGGPLYPWDLDKPDTCRNRASDPLY